MTDFSFIREILPQDRDERFMLEALKEAVKAYREKEVPVGSVLVRDDRVVARGHNQVELLRDATAHAEMLCITAGSASEENWRLTGMTLYSTLEPCCMCAGAMFLSRIDRLAYGTRDFRHGACGSFVNLFEKKHPTHSLEVSGGILSDACALLLKRFFEERRES